MRVPFIWFCFVPKDPSQKPWDKAKQSNQHGRWKRWRGQVQDGKPTMAKRVFR